MKTAEVRARVRGIIRASVIDADQGAEMEDELHFDVLNAIASGTCESPLECAREAVQTRRVTLRRGRK